MTTLSDNITAGIRSEIENRPDVESFYHLRHTEVGHNACHGLACFVARHLNPKRWQEACAAASPVNCLGKCFCAPAHGSDDCRPRCHIDAREGIVLSRIVRGGARSLNTYHRYGGYEALEGALKQSPESIIQTVDASELRGRGGAGFPTGRKWRLAARQPATPKFVVANADEGDPGAYVDRFILEEDPHCLVEGLALAGYAVGAAKGWIYLRCEYPAAREILEAAITESRAAGVLGQRILGSDFSFDVEIRVGQGSYVCGEETALFNSIQDMRPVATARPPYATEQGLFGRPTVINNVETLANIPWIVRHGGKAFYKLGIPNSRGTKVVSLNSLFNRPGLYEVEFGIPLRRIVEDLGGGLKDGEIKGLMIGGPLAGVVPPHLFDTRFGFEELRAIAAAVGHGGVIAFDQYTSIPELIHHVFEFAAFESCGKCVPCREGCRSIERLFRRITQGGRATQSDRREWIDILVALKLTSLCGLGSGAAEFAESILQHYSRELEPCFA